ncbi:MAG TPA: FkbM family methyltransferase [Methylomirabilota bacterium]|nr:FkbM family methyltransferase [Methylomirabilota bacterium]
MPENLNDSLSHRLWMKSRPLIARHRRNPLFKGIARLSSLWLKAYENCSGNFAMNGEEMVLRSLGGAPVQTVFDVGANRGDWSLLAHRLLPNARIYAFELSPPTFESLRQNTRTCDTIEIFNFGLSDHDGETFFYHYPEKSGETSVIAHPFQSGGVEMKGHLHAGDVFCAEHGIQKIDLLKIDVEGAEAAVLHGFKKMLAAKKISVIQFEYEKLNTATKFLLKDFYALLGDCGYAIGKIFPTYIDFRDYVFEHEILWGSNYLAVLKDQPDWLNRFPK